MNLTDFMLIESELMVKLKLPFIEGGIKIR